MTDKEILDKVITKVIDNGWDYTNWEEKTDLLIRCENNIYLMANHYHYPILIFSHEFCKAFFGEKDFSDEDVDGCTWYYDSALGAEYTWQVHLQQMVLEKEPLRYLEKFL